MLSKRQQEFVRLHAAGMPARKAAIAAGYAASTARASTARLYANPAIALALAERYQAKAKLHASDVRDALNRLRDIITHCPDNRLALRAIEKIRLMHKYDTPTRAVTNQDIPIQ